jgi:hypothetical protein
VEFNCHINLEVCASIKSVKYIHKYIYKGNDVGNNSVVGGYNVRSKLCLLLHLQDKNVQP